MPWEIGREVFRHTDWTHPRTTTTVRNAKGLVEVQVADVCSEIAWLTQAYHGVHVGPIEVNLTTVFMNNAADFRDGLFKHTVGGGIGHHECREPIRVLLSLHSQVFQINVAL